MRWVKRNRSPPKDRKGGNLFFFTHLTVVSRVRGVRFYLFSPPPCRDALPAPRSRSPVSCVPRLIVLPRSCSCRWGPCPSPTPGLSVLFIASVPRQRAFVIMLSCLSAVSALPRRLRRGRWPKKRHRLHAGTNPDRSHCSDPRRRAAAGHRRAGSRGTRPRRHPRQRGESTSRQPADMAVAMALSHTHTHTDARAPIPCPVSCEGAEF